MREERVGRGPLTGRKRNIDRKEERGRGTLIGKKRAYRLLMGRKRGGRG